MKQPARRVTEGFSTMQIDAIAAHNLRNNGNTDITTGQSDIRFSAIVDPYNVKAHQPLYTHGTGIASILCTQPDECRVKECIWTYYQSATWARLNTNDLVRLPTQSSQTSAFGSSIRELVPDSSARGLLTSDNAFDLLSKMVSCIWVLLHNFCSSVLFYFDHPVSSLWTLEREQKESSMEPCHSHPLCLCWKFIEPCSMSSMNQFRSNVLLTCPDLERAKTASWVKSLRFCLMFHGSKLHI